MRQMTLNKGLSRMGICSHVQRAAIPSKGFFHQNNSCTLILALVATALFFHVVSRPQVALNLAAQLTCDLAVRQRTPSLLSYEGSTVVVEHQDKDQAAGLEVAESFILCGHQAFRTHIKNIAVFVHKDDRMEVAQGRFSGKEGEADLTRLESGMSFMQVRASMSMKEKLRQVRGAICENR
jgi:hypothetical protein